eukprot:222072_1
MEHEESIHIFAAMSNCKVEPMIAYKPIINNQYYDLGGGIVQISYNMLHYQTSNYLLQIRPSSDHPIQHNILNLHTEKDMLLWCNHFNFKTNNRGTWYQTCSDADHIGPVRIKQVFIDQSCTECALSVIIKVILKIHQDGARSQDFDVLFSNIEQTEDQKVFLDAEKLIGYFGLCRTEQYTTNSDDIWCSLLQTFICI